MFLNKAKASVKTSDQTSLNEIAAAHASPGVRLIACGCVVGASGILLGFGYLHFKDNPEKEVMAVGPAQQAMPAKLNVRFLPADTPPAPQVQHTAYPPGMSDQAPPAQAPQQPQQNTASNGAADQAAAQKAAALAAQKAVADAAKARRLLAGFGDEMTQSAAAVLVGDGAAPGQPGQPARPAITQGAPGAQTVLAAMLVPSDTPQGMAGYIASPHMTMSKGTGITCTLGTAIDTEQSGFGFCITDYPVRSMDGSTVLMERGTKIDYEYARGMAHGAKSVFLLFTRAVTPTWRTINLFSPGTDPLGRSGLAGEVNNKFWARFGGALVFAVLQDGVGIATRAGSNGGNTQINLGNTQATGTTAAGEILTQNRDVMPSMTINHGTSVGITLARDLDFSSVYGLALKSTQ